MMQQQRRTTTAVPLAPAHAQGALTEVECTWIKKRTEQWIRFGRVAAERIIDRRRVVKSFRAGATFAFVQWQSNDHGTIASSILVMRAVGIGEPYSTHPFIRPGGECLLSVEGWPKVRQVLGAIDAVEAVDVDPCDASPDHWRHVGNRLTAGLPFRPYSAERHAAWLRRKALEA